MEKIQNKTECLKIIKQICENLDEDLNTPFCQEIRTHLQQCPLCCAYVDSIRDTILFCRKLIDEDVPQGVDERLWRVLHLSRKL